MRDVLYRISLPFRVIWAIGVIIFAAILMVLGIEPKWKTPES